MPWIAEDKEWAWGDGRIGFYADRIDDECITLGYESPDSFMSDKVTITVREFAELFVQLMNGDVGAIQAPSGLITYTKN